MSETGETPSTREQSAPIDVTESLPNLVATRPFYAAVASLLERPWPRSTLVALFGGRATYGAIRGWLYGRRSAPQWAIDLLRAHADLRARSILNHAAALKRATRTRAEVGRQRAHANNARRECAKLYPDIKAMLDDCEQKEKARQQGGPV
jgi:hypothetical protein